MKKKVKKQNLLLTGFILIMLAPAVIHLIVFWAGVQVQTIGMAFTDPDTNKFVWFDNFRLVFDALFAKKDMLIKLRNTSIFFLIGLLEVPLCIFVSYLISKKTIGAGFMKNLLYLPGAVSGLMMAMIYSELMSRNGLLFDVIVKLGWDKTLSFSAEDPLLYVALYDIWIGLGGNLVIWLGTMSRIPTELYESGELDGITTFKEFIYIVMPLIWPTFVTMITLQVVGFFGSSGSILLLAPNAGDSVNTLSYWLYSVVLVQKSDQYNYATAAGLFFTVLTIPLVVGSRAFLNKFGEAVEY